MSTTFLLYLKSLKNDKATCVDSVSPELIKADGKPVINFLLQLFNAILKTNKVPKSLNYSIIFKKGDRLNCKTYRLITSLEPNNS